jgi:hypothetical protein
VERPVDTRDDAEQILVTVPIPREALTLVAPPPVLVSQKNVERVIGVPPESYLRMLRAPDFTPPIIADGKLRLVRREDFVAWLATHRKAPARPAPAAHPGKTSDGAADILREVGARPARRRG